MYAAQLLFFEVVLAFAAFVAALETLNAARGVDDFFLAGEERVAGRA